MLWGRIDPRPYSATHSHGVQHMVPDLDISNLSLDDLLADAASPADRGPRKRNLVEDWLLAEGYHPGQTRMASGELYARFRKWAEAQEARPIPVVSTWGVAMAMRFKKGRSKHGNFYYISRESGCLIPQSLERGGGGNAGGSTPGG